jgi:alpha-D-glucose phosphate-specific phosphoglucomutase
VEEMIKFGTDGYRAIIADKFTFSNFKKIIFGIAKFLEEKQLKERKIVIGYDSRFLSEKFALLAGEIFSSFGIHSYITERDTPTPVVANFIRDKKLAGGVMITASHNPPEYQGVKFIPEYAGPALPDITSEIEENIKNLGDLEYRKNEKLIEFVNPQESYFRQLKKVIDFEKIKKARIKVVYDPMFATGREYLDKILREEGIIVEVFHNFRDPLFGGKLPDPQEKNLSEIREYLIENKFDLGLATDGDADRFGILDGEGNYFNANKIISLLYKYLLEKEKGPAARTVATTHLIDRIANSAGEEVIETPVGFKYIGEVLRNRGVIIGGEESGGLSVKKHIPEKDGILACLLVCEMVSFYQMPLSLIYKNLVSEVGELFNKRIDIHIGEEKKKEILENLSKNPPENFSGFKIEKTITVDGFKAILSNGNWFLIRASGTEPLIRVYLEADSRENLEKMEEEIKNILG